MSLLLQFLPKVSAFLQCTMYQYISEFLKSLRNDTKTALFLIIYNFTEIVYDSDNCIQIRVKYLNLPIIMSPHLALDPTWEWLLITLTLIYNYTEIVYKYDEYIGLNVIYQNLPLIEFPQLSKNSFFFCLMNAFGLFYKNTEILWFRYLNMPIIARYSQMPTNQWVCLPIFRNTNAPPVEPPEEVIVVA